MKTIILIALMFASTLAIGATPNSYSCKDHKSVSSEAQDTLLVGMIRGGIGSCKFVRGTYNIDDSGQVRWVHVERNGVNVLSTKIPEGGVDHNLTNSDSGRDFLSSLRDILNSCGCIQ